MIRIFSRACSIISDSEVTRRKGQLPCEAQGSNLRGESGLDLLENVQADKELSVIIMTGMPSTDTAIRALRNRAEDYLQKPFELESLDESLERILKRRGRELNLRD